MEEYVDDFIKCDGCGRLVDPGESFLQEEAGQWFCADCLAEEESRLDPADQLIVQN